jgi:hypothetical protein
MVKIPNMDDLKKAGANLMDSAKSGSLVDKFKSGVEQIGVNLNKMEAGTVKSTDPVVMQFEAVQAALAAVVEAQAAQTKLIEQARAQLVTLTKTVATLQALQPTTPPTENKE